MEIERVQTLAGGGLNELPPQFVRLSHERPENSKAIEGVTVTVISLSQLHDVIVDEISRACSEWGFFLVTDHGVSPVLIQRVKEMGEEFFKLPQKEKERYANDPSSGSSEGYGTKTGNLDDRAEWVDYFFHLMHPPPKVNYGIWPKTPPSYREVTAEYNVELLQVANKLLELLSEGLGLEGTTPRSCLGGEEIEFKMRINMYPPCPQPHLALGVKPHTDLSGLTFLLPTDVPGLQVWKDGNWVAVHI